MIAFLVLMSAWIVPPTFAQDRVPIDMGADWLRRDWDHCEDGTVMRSGDGEVTIESDHSAALFWQIPTRQGPLPIDRNQDWIKKCKRLPLDFESRVLRRVSEKRELLEVRDLPYFSWRWKVNGTIDDGGLADSKGRIQKKGDDFAAKIGIVILRKGTRDLREIAYIWTRSLPKETVLTQETILIPYILKLKWQRIVAESGDLNVGKWVDVTRNLYRDYKRLYPDEDPGQIVRIYLMTDSDNTGSRVTGAFADLVFSASPANPRSIKASHQAPSASQDALDRPAPAGR